MSGIFIEKDDDYTFDHTKVFYKKTACIRKFENVMFDCYYSGFLPITVHRVQA
jgi:hypothetical protein